ncbi:CIA30 family protein [Guyparkeria sp. SCN-R1]|uniref:CIA30 family protein n=1 Tax=Guyparkeria sp. SCN-R1 TaxID=2341113 RepID=UPI000F64DE04|nr:CIA30 family protein [Guyparkeria sp. SCN-R1]RRQ23314.1 CIA30 family protein [Guyparkeria sp. SCN-R1]
MTSFLDPAQSDHWHAVNDGVMGGVSAGAFHFDDGIGVFSGELSLEHGGGFASVRRAVSPGVLADSGGIAIRVRGDGRRYQCRVGTEETAPDISYATDFDTIDGQWLDVHMAWQEFEAVRRGHAVPNAPHLSPERINRLGFLLADRRAGPFCLEIASIRAA